MDRLPDIIKPAIWAWVAINVLAILWTAFLGYVLVRLVLDLQAWSVQLGL